MPYALEGPKWGPGDRGTTATITWSFADSNLTSALSSSYDGYPTLTNGINSDNRNSLRSAFALWSAVTGLTFVEQPDAASNDLRVGQAYIDGSGPIAGMGIKATTRSSPAMGII